MYVNCYSLTHGSECLKSIPTASGPLAPSLERDDEMMAKGLIKALARRIQTLRKERGYNPTDILDKASILELDQESLDLIKEKVSDIAFLVRVKNVDFTESCKEYKEEDIDGLKIRIGVEWFYKRLTISRVNRYLMGLNNIYEKVSQYYDEYGDWLRPSKLLKSLADTGKSFGSFSNL